MWECSRDLKIHSNITSILKGEKFHLDSVPSRELKANFFSLFKGIFWDDCSTSNLLHDFAFISWLRKVKNVISWRAWRFHFLPISFFVHFFDFLTHTQLRILKFHPFFSQPFHFLQMLLLLLFLKNINFFVIFSQSWMAKKTPLINFIFISLTKGCVRVALGLNFFKIFFQGMMREFVFDFHLNVKRICETHCQILF